MTVYVDELQQYGSRFWCHMATDAEDIEELHRFAEQIGLRRSWFQDHRLLPHYDLTKGRRAAAICAGAIELPSPELVRRCR